MRFSLSRCRIGPDVFQIAVGIPQPIEPVLLRWILPAIDMIERLARDVANGSETSQREAACLTLSRLLLCSLAAAPRWRHPPVACASLRHTGNTNGALTVTEFVIPPKQGPALHTHLREDEVWYILEGDFRFKAGDEMLRSRPAAWPSARVAAARRPVASRRRRPAMLCTPHTFQNVGDTSGRLLVITTPSGPERFFEQFAELPPGQVDPQMIAALGHANWVEFIGPPLALSDPL